MQRSGARPIDADVVLAYACHRPPTVGGSMREVEVAVPSQSGSFQISFSSGVTGVLTHKNPVPFTGGVDDRKRVG